MDDDFGAMSVRAFAQRTGIGLTLAWREIKEGRLRAIKVSSRTLVRHGDAREWLDSRPDARISYQASIAKRKSSIDAASEAKMKRS